MVVDAGATWLTWNAKHRCLMMCGPDAASYVQGRDQKTIYTADWMLPAKHGWPTAAEVTVTVIDAVEYDEILAMLNDGEEIPDIPEPEPPQPDPDEPEEPEPEERPMTIAEMRQFIADQQEQINMLTDCILEMSEVVYGG